MQTVPETQPGSTEQVIGLKCDMRAAIRDFRLDDAKSIYARLTEQFNVDPDADDMLTPRVQIGVLDGRKLEMLQMLNGLDEARAPGLKAICLQLMGDPLWEGMALDVEQATDDPNIRRSMQLLLSSRVINEPFLQ